MTRPDTNSGTRYPICDWPLADSAENGCVEGNCSYRPQYGSEEWHRIQRNRVAAWVNAAQGQISLTDTAKSMKAMLEEGEANRKPDREPLLKPMTI